MPVTSAASWEGNARRIILLWFYLLTVQNSFLSMLSGGGVEPMQSLYSV